MVQVFIFSTVIKNSVVKSIYLGGDSLFKQGIQTGYMEVESVDLFPR
jgi:hypothetical protein